MIDWQQNKRVTADLFSQLLGVSLSQIRWEDEPEASTWCADPMIRLLFTSLTGLGWEEERRDDDGVNDGIVTVCGPRLFTLTCKIESIAARAVRDQQSPLALCSNLITKLSRTSSVDFLNDYYGICDYTDIKRVPYLDSDGRQVNRYAVDFFCETEDNDVDTTPGAGGFINEVIGDGKVQDGTVQRDVPYDVKGS